MRLDLYFNKIQQKISEKGVKVGVKHKTETVIPLEENIGRNLPNIDLGADSWL